MENFFKIIKAFFVFFVSQMSESRQNMEEILEGVDFSIFFPNDNDSSEQNTFLSKGLSFIGPLIFLSFEILRS